jgi:hypothetical protein
MKILSEMILVALLTICAMFTGPAVYAEPDAPGENKASMSLLGWPHLEAEKGFHVVFDAFGSYGPIRGYMQTPLGGAPSSASDRRPKFDELGINMMTMVNLSLSVSKDQHSIYGDAHLVDLSGDGTPDQSLIFHGKEYPSGTRIKSDVNLSWYEIGYQYNIRFSKERSNFNIAPTVAFALWDFSTELESGGEKNNRSYVKGTPRIGVNLEWLPWKKFSVSGKAIGSVPLKNTPDIYTVGLSGKYDLLSKGRLRISLFAGVEYNLINYKDSQTVPNHIRAGMGPLGLAGLEIKF